ncbi:MlaC/ttg2D family ABC transporter substrate-binding protein [Hydrogenophaga aquatica]
MIDSKLNHLPRRAWLTAAGAFALTANLPLAWAEGETPEALIQRIAGELIEQVKNDRAIQAGDLAKVVALVDSKIMPHVNFTRMTASAVGRFWRQATPEQKQRLQEEFKTLLVRTYAGALSQLKDQTLTLKPSRSRPEDTEVVVRSEVRGKGDPVQLDYRLEKTPSGWKVYDINVLGVWLVETYRGQFAQEINTKGIDGLIASLVERNRANAAKAS